MSCRLGIIMAAALMVTVVLAGCAEGASPPGGRPPSGSAAAAPPCSASLLLQAAVAAQHFSTDPAEYPAQPGQGPGAYDPVCDGAWAIALISHPNVGTTDGEALFHSEGGSWAYVEGLGGIPADCLLEKAGVPAGVATFLWPPSRSQPSSYCSQ